jgi:flavorubredoxin
MKDVFRAAKVTDRVYWVGAVDWAVRDFHGYATRRGTTYNAYLVMADRVTLIDTVKHPFQKEMLARVASVIDPGKVDCLISNHSEPDHSGSLPGVIAAVKPDTVYASTMGAKALDAHFHLDREIVPVKDGESLSLGDMNATFVETRMLHWPDSMFTYLHEDRLLFSSDAFGMHLASTERFADEIPEPVLAHEAAKYYANILLPYSPLVTKLLEKVGGLGLPIEIIAPDHGPIYRTNTAWPLERYAEWARQEPTRKAVVAYATMWKSTEAMARAVVEGLAEGGATAKLLPLEAAHRSDVATELLDAGALLVGSPTLNNGLFPTMADLLAYLKGLRPRNLVGAAFGSYGWSGESLKLLNEALTAMNVELVSDGVRCVYVPSDDVLAECRALGVKVAETLKAGD